MKPVQTSSGKHEKILREIGETRGVVNDFMMWTRVYDLKEKSFCVQRELPQRDRIEMVQPIYDGT